MNFVANTFKSLISIFIIIGFVVSVVFGVSVLNETGSGIAAFIAALGGVIATIAIFGVLALMIQNNDLLRRISNNLDAIAKQSAAPSPDLTPESKEFIDRFPVRKDPPVTG